MLRICPDCASYSADLIQAKYRPIIEREAAKNAHKVAGYDSGFLRFLTLTTSTKLGANIGTACKDLLDKARDFYRETWGDESGVGAIANLEGGEHGLRLHCHLIVQGSYKAQSELSERWQRMTGNIITHISLISADKAVKEGLKYITKTAKLSPSQLVDLHNALKGTRRIRSWGCFYNAAVDEDESNRETECPVCQARLRYTGELAFEQWREDNKKRRQEAERNQIQRVIKSLESLLHLTDANKFCGSGPPSAQISYLEGPDNDLDALLADVKPQKRGLQ